MKVKLKIWNKIFNKQLRKILKN